MSLFRAGIGSLAREAKLEKCVIRLLTPAIFAPRLHNLSTVFIAGNASFLSVIENVQFNLKGTPSASEVEFLIFLLEQQLAALPAESPPKMPQGKPSFEGLGFGSSAEIALASLAERAEGNLAGLINIHMQMLEHRLAPVDQKVSLLAIRVQGAWKDDILDEFAAVEVKELLDHLIQNIHRPEWCQALQRSFLSAFVKHQPQYQPKACLVTSGSSRTALAILGFNCGISEIVIPDLSWYYEQCFPKVHAVPSTDTLELDVEAMIESVQNLCQR